jgi:hypothetical protein
MEENPIYDGMQKHYHQLQATARIEARMELVKKLKEIKRPVKQVLDLIKEYELRDAKA